MLIPLFGIQLFVTIYRLPAGQPGGAEYEQFTVFVTNSQVSPLNTRHMRHRLAGTLFPEHPRFVTNSQVSPLNTL